MSLLKLPGRASTATPSAAVKQARDRVTTVQGEIAQKAREIESLDARRLALLTGDAAAADIAANRSALATARADRDDLDVMLKHAEAKLGESIAAEDRAALEAELAPLPGVLADMKNLDGEIEKALAGVVDLLLEHHGKVAIARRLDELAIRRGRPDLGVSGISGYGGIPDHQNVRIDFGEVRHPVAYAIDAATGQARRIA